MQNELCQLFPDPNGRDWVQVGIKNYITNRGKIVKAKAGDMILFDSRLFHGGKFGTGEAQVDKKEDRLARLSITVCMTDKKRATKEALDKRI